MADAIALRDPNRNPTLQAVSSVSGSIVNLTSTPISGVNPLNVAIVDGSGTQITSFGGGTQYTDAGTPPAHPVGGTLEFNNAGVWATVGSANPLPVSGSLSIVNPTIGAAVPATANYIAGNKAGNLTGLLIGSQTTANSLSVALASDQASIPVAATLSAETTKTIGTIRLSNGTNTMDVASGSYGKPGLVIRPHDSGGFSDAYANNPQNYVDENFNQIIQGVFPFVFNGTTWDRMHSVGTGIQQVANTPVANTGWSFNYQSALSSTKAQIKGSAGTFGGYVNLYNPNIAVTYIQVFNKASANVTVGTTAPDFVITLPGVATASATGSDRNLEITNGIAMNTGITIAATTTPTGSTAPANAIVATFLYI